MAGGARESFPKCGALAARRRHGRGLNTGPGREPMHLAAAAVNNYVKAAPRQPVSRPRCHAPPPRPQARRLGTRPCGAMPCRHGSWVRLFTPRCTPSESARSRASRGLRPHRPSDGPRIRVEYPRYRPHAVSKGSWQGGPAPPAPPAAAAAAAAAAAGSRTRRGEQRRPGVRGPWRLVSLSPSGRRMRALLHLQPHKGRGRAVREASATAGAK